MSECVCVCVCECVNMHDNNNYHKTRTIKMYKVSYQKKRAHHTNHCQATWFQKHTHTHTHTHTHAYRISRLAHSKEQATHLAQSSTTHHNNTPNRCGNYHTIMTHGIPNYQQIYMQIPYLDEIYTFYVCICI